jgi:hypothetical protein
MWDEGASDLWGRLAELERETELLDAVPTYQRVCQAGRTAMKVPCYVGRATRSAAVTYCHPPG